MTNQMKELIERELLKQMRHDVDRGALRYDALTTDQPFNIFYCDSPLSESALKELSEIYYKYEDYIHAELEKHFDRKFGIGA